MDEFLGSIQFNPNGDLIISSSYLTFQYWTGFIGYLSARDSYSEFKNKQLILSCLKVRKNFDSGVCDAAWTSSEHVLVATDNGEVVLNQIDNFDNSFVERFCKREHDGPVLCVESVYDSSRALSGSDDARIKLWDLEQQISIKTYKAHDYAVTSLNFNPNDIQQFLSCSQDNNALMWDIRKQLPAFSINHCFSGYPSCCSWSKIDSNLIAIGSETGQLAIFDVRSITQKPMISSQVHNRLIRSIHFSPNLDLIATASEDCKTKLFKINKNTENALKEIYSYQHNDYVTDLTWHPTNHSEYLTCSWDGYLKSHEFSLKQLNGH